MSSTKNLYKTLEVYKVHLAAFIAAGVFIGWIGFAVLKSPLKTTKEVVINEGQGVSAIADILKEENVIDNKFAFVVYVIVTGNEKKLQAGRYIFKPGVTTLAIVNSMVEGFAESDDIVITIPEGFNVFDIDKRLASAGLTKEGEFAKKYQNNEGQFFPDTYRLSQMLATDSYDLITVLRQKAADNYDEKTKEILAGLSEFERERIIIIASILEKEARTEKDMKLVAGIIYKRMELGMLLQIDATVLYGACLREFEESGFKKNCDVTFQGPAREIKVDGPYNSYMRTGLPPGPISNPGLKAIEAARNPVKSDYLYYLSTRDGSQMIYSKTAGEHVANRKKYLGF
ncbi:MAG: hypothetical protein A2655_04900 [Candidatus Yanofskybacteria bacterium RIFCSPHIGHO2_01_FULL_43_42]|uniref:Endolytic murein transglycosylase n=1 Tax=Candidatus Yanofskybacteria bacterium RIFCSPLOWO2_01_FULL_43_22 TaxID=1802695 RepID=A0A1F8GLA8_9BACT|nr:MAG: hypothetical protein A2655_04900 [Candidatus Yanofskybacteria bacterium RIFCSPHIGHO2_01_FULL_43_42]OGN13624.1 MAG: hypothetical protein A3D48_00880 [Candidatus Yanofskybacteria bacterium RIFCSPHIGHO2_02_FULL_43_17]OGN25199.1 MAG: hypothetical protein A3A13_03910 [Candidatus Yanofskybacteria bacterium RIFCSPLOWO2_01_FULL_43_22]